MLVNSFGDKDTHFFSIIARFPRKTFKKRRRNNYLYKNMQQHLHPLYGSSCCCYYIGVNTCSPVFHVNGC